MSKFEVIVYNREVREKVKEGERHRQFTDDWADLHYIEIDASDETSARERAESRYPSEQGFVIESVQSLNSGFE
ncbi:MAG: hypothetical protein O3B76_03780 [Proteobacteria bacterium]|nr:hypothetical protein [Pseudomonadota bacterium]MDA1022680.1 hypothetical protein [Pseudomonadota bacterium]